MIRAKRIFAPLLDYETIPVMQSNSASWTAKPHQCSFEQKEASGLLKEEGIEL
jgi:hypothetical protein